MRRRVGTAIAVLVGLLAIVGLGLWAYLRQSLPQMDGVVPVGGISASLDIVRDADAIPHIFASSRADGLFGLGYVHAQDRLWQMELQRRIGFGRLAEILGPGAVAQDRFLRTVGFGRAARASWETMPEGAKGQVNAYIAGVNAFIAAHHGRQLPPEFTLLRFEPEPWTGADVVVWEKMMAWDLSANYSFELLRHDLVQVVGAERMRELLPPYPEHGLSILHEVRTEKLEGRRTQSNPGGLLLPSKFSLLSSAWASALSQGVPAVSELLLGGRTEALGSNNWVVDGTLTASGKPLLANDPHLGTRIPSTWYLAHVSAGDFDVIGATLPGTPAVALGRNRHIAWGATNVAADVEDLYRERLDASGRFAEFRGVREPLTVVSEVITVKNAPPVKLDVRISRHGPLVSDAINAVNASLAAGPRPPPLEPLALRWTALDPNDTTLASFLDLNGARNWTDFTAALRGFVVPSQNFVYADVEGHIGYYAPGRIPIRAAGDGALPADGWTGDAEWTGWVPFDDLPHGIDPPEHFYVTANNRPLPPGYRYSLGLEWPEPYRAQRATDLIVERLRSARFEPDDFSRMQADTLSLHATALLPVLVAHAHPVSRPDREAFEVLRQWNRDMRSDSAAAAIFEAWFLQLAPALVGNTLGPTLTTDYGGRFTFVTRFVSDLLTSPAGSAWCGAAGPGNGAGRGQACDETVTLALSEAVTALTRRLGGDMARWRWDAVHRAVFPHQGLDAVPALRPLLNRSAPHGGDWSTLNVGPVSTTRLYEQRSVPGYREIVDLSSANDSRFLDAVGESGHFLSRHYDDYLPDWAGVRYRPMRMERSAVERGMVGRLRLVPR